MSDRASSRPRTRMVFGQPTTLAPSIQYRAPHWYACRTKARAEKKVAEVLERHSVECYLPLVERERQWADRTKRVQFPMFPGYVFARFRLDEPTHGRMRASIVARGERSAA